jgi:hypothetical protein
MTLPAYTLGNQEFAFFVARAGEVLKERGIPYTVVGGVAVQAHILDRLCRYHKRDIVSLTLDEGFQDQEDYLRATNAVDIAIRFPEYDQLGNSCVDMLKFDEKQAHLSSGAKVNDICRAIVENGDNGDYLSFDGEHIFSYVLERTGVQRPFFSVSVDGTLKNSICLKTSRKPQDLEGLDKRFYNIFIDNCVDLTIPFNHDWNLNLRVLKPEDLLAVKIALDRPKDAMDTRNLVDAMRLVGEFDKSPEFPRFAYQLRECLLPKYATQLERFAADVKLDPNRLYGKSHTGVVCSRE